MCAHFCGHILTYLVSYSEYCLGKRSLFRPQCKIIFKHCVKSPQRDFGVVIFLNVRKSSFFIRCTSNFHRLSKIGWNLCRQIFKSIPYVFLKLWRILFGVRFFLDHSVYLIIMNVKMPVCVIVCLRVFCLPKAFKPLSVERWYFQWMFSDFPTT